MRGRRGEGEVKERREDRYEEGKERGRREEEDGEGKGYERGM